MHCHQRKESFEVRSAKLEGGSEQPIQVTGKYQKRYESIADRVRKMRGLYADGAELTDAAFSTKNPLIRINLFKMIPTRVSIYG